MFFHLKGGNIGEFGQVRYHSENIATLSRVITEEKDKVRERERQRERDREKGRETETEERRDRGEKRQR